MAQLTLTPSLAAVYHPSCSHNAASERIPGILVDAHATLWGWTYGEVTGTRDLSIRQFFLVVT